MATGDSSASAAGAVALAEVERLKRRDQAAWSNLFENHHPQVFQAVLAQVGSRAVAEDIAAQVFLEALQGIGRYRERSKPISEWLLAIARRRGLDWLREQERLAQISLTRHVPAIEPEEIERALEAIHLLPPREREIILLRYVEGYPIDAVARLTNRPLSAVKLLQQRGLDSLRHLLLRPDEG